MPGLRRKSSVRTDSAAYRKVKSRAKARSAAITLAGQDIGALPPVQDPARRARADKDFRFFCETYFPHLFTLAWSDDHLRVMAKIERVVRRGETLAVAMPRGSGKTTLCLVATAWCILSGQHWFVYLISSDEDEARKRLANIKTHLSANARLLADYPEAIYPIRMLEGETRRCVGQRYYGVPTLIGWGADEITMPTIPGSRSGGAIIRVSGLTGNIRGALHVRADGEQVRPSLVICDDPQTDQSAHSKLQTAERLSILNGAIYGLAGPGMRTAIIVPCTVIQQGDMADQLLNRQQNPHWHGERTKMVYSFPSNQRLWDEYARLRAESLKADGDGREATEFYAAHREAMDAGAVVAWAGRHNPDELSAIQGAMNLKLRDEATFCAEYQNEPLALGEDTGDLLTADEIAGKFNGHARGAVPLGCNYLTLFIDVHDRLLYWMATAWGDGMAGFVIDYGTYPEQRRAWFTMRDARTVLADRAPGADREGAIRAGLELLVERLMGREWKRQDGAALRIDRCLIDSGYVPDTVYLVIRRGGRAGVLPSRGVGIGAAGKPFSDYKRLAGEQYGWHWRIPSVKGKRELRTVNVDVNYWKSFVLSRLSLAVGDLGGLTLFGKKAAEHRLLADHLSSEYYVRTEGRGRKVDEWKMKAGTTENHWWDAIVGCAVAASTLGCTPTTRPVGAQKKRKKRKAAVGYL